MKTFYYGVNMGEMHTPVLSSVNIIMPIYSLLQTRPSPVQQVEPVRAKP